VTEVVWESRPVAHTSGSSELDAHVETGEKVLGEITFDIVVPEEGGPNVEGCYRIDSGNWEVYYFTNWYNGASWIGAPIVRSKAIFQVAFPEFAESFLRTGSSTRQSRKCWLRRQELMYGSR
jgi:hypothetical protein